MILGLTGKIGSGKHTAALILQKAGFVLIDADKLAHTLYLPKTVGWTELVAEFSTKILNAEREIDRQKLGEIVFADQAKLKKLNQILHPALRLLLQKQVQEYQKQGLSKILIVAALAEELNLKQIVDYLLVIDAPLSKRIEWLTKKRGMSAQMIKERDSLQKETQDFDFKILNQGDLTLLEEALNSILTKKTSH